MSTYQDPTTPQPVPQMTENRSPMRPATLIWGAIVLIVGVSILAIAYGYYFDPVLWLIVLLSAAGVALIAGSIASAARRNNR